MTTFVRPVAEPVEEYKEPVTPTWVTDFFLPLAQNLAAGVAVALMGMIGVIAYTGTLTGQAPNTMVDLYNAAVWCLLIGGIPACILTVVRFWGDELGLLQSAYRTGYADAQAALMPQIANLQLELRVAYDVQNKIDMLGGGASSVINERMQELQKTRSDATKIIEVAFLGDSTSRDAMKKRDMGQRDWERAMRMIVGAGVMNDTRMLRAKTPAEAYKALDEQLVALKKQPDSYRANWE